jgi:hypothetical protein
MPKIKTQPRYTFSFRYTEEVRNALQKIMKQRKINQNKAVEQAILGVASFITNNK